MKTRLPSLLSYFLLAFLFAISALSQVPTPQSSAKLTTATCGKPVCTWNAFGPITYTRNTGQPQTVSNSFSVLNPNTQFTLHIDNKGVSSAAISANGTQVFGPSDFNPSVTSLDRAVTLSAGNTVQVQLRGKPGTSLAVTIIGVDSDPPSIIETEAPLPNSFGWNNTNVNVSFACGDKTSGVASCPVLQTLATEGLNQVVAGTAFDLAGNSATASIQISIDKTPPTILPSQNPPANSFGWNNSAVTVGFLCNDNLSGVQACTPPMLLSNQGQNQSVIGMATDFAGNSATSSSAVSIDLTPPTIVATSAPAPNSSGWNNTPVTMSFSCTDYLSGVASCPASESVSSEGVNQTISGTASDKAGNSASTSMDLNIDLTPPIVTINSPTSGATVTSANLQITGTASDNLSGLAAVSCNGSTAVLSSGAFSCNVSLVAGANTISVQAVDKAGNTANTQVSITFNPAPPIPVNAILITPSVVNMLAGSTRTVALVGDIGQQVFGATWSIGDPTIVSISNTDPPQLTALGQGTATLTATFGSLNATMTINVFGGTALPVGTPLWSFDPLPGNGIPRLVKANPLSPGDPDIYATEAPNTLRGFSADGRELWAIQVNLPLPQNQSAASSQSSSLTASAKTSITTSVVQNQTPISRPVSPALEKIIAAHKQFLRDHQVPDPLDFMMQRLKTAADMPVLHASAATKSTALTLASPLDATGSSDLTGQTLISQTIADNQGGTIEVVRTCLVSNCNTVIPGFVRVDNSTQAQSWSQQLTDGPYIFGVAPIAIGPDNTIYATGIFQTGVANGFGIPARATLVGVDGITGALKFSVPLPSSHTHFTLTDTDGTVLDDQQSDGNAVVGPIAVMEDGSLRTLVFTAQFTELDSQGGFSSSGQRICLTGIGAFNVTCPLSISDHKKLQLLTIQQGGGSSLEDVQSYDLDVSGCQPNCSDPGEANNYIPGDVIPDGLGGTLASFTQNQEQNNITNIFHLSQKIRHIDSSGSFQDFDLPGLIPNNLAADQGTFLVRGQNNVAFGVGAKIVAFDVTTGAQLCSTPFLFPRGASLLAPTTDQGVVGTELTQPIFGASDALEFLDTTCTPTFFGLPASLLGVSFFDQSTLLASTLLPTGEALGTPMPTPTNAGNIFMSNGDAQTRRAPAPLAITRVARNRGMIGSKTNLFVIGTNFGDSPELIFGDPAKPNTDLTLADTPRYNKDQGVITVDVQVSATATPGKVPIFIKSGTKISAKNNNAFFFVQIPKSVAGTASEFDNIPASGIGPLHTPVNETVTFADGKTISNQCGVYRFFALQLLDQDTPQQPIKTVITIDEAFSDCQTNGSATCPNATPAATNSAGVVLDFRALLVKFPSCPKSGDNASFTQGFSVTIGDKKFDLTTKYQLKVGDFDGTLKVDSTQKTP